MLNRHKSSSAAMLILKNPIHYQSGVVMAISLIILLALTIIGITSMQVTGTEEKMAANSKNTAMAFQAADTALRAAELTLAGTSPPTFSVANNGIGGLYTTLGVGALPSYYQSIDWDSTNTVKPYAVYTSGTLTGIHHPPAYIIEQLATSTTEGASSSLESTSSASESVDETWYRITARAIGTDHNAVVILQSIYKR